MVFRVRFFSQHFFFSFSLSQCSLFSGEPPFPTNSSSPRAGLTTPFSTSPSPFGSLNQPAMRSSFADRVASIAVSRFKVGRKILLKKSESEIRDRQRATRAASSVETVRNLLCAISHCCARSPRALNRPGRRERSTLALGAMN